jgi:hypothetical protein
LQSNTLSAMKIRNSVLPILFLLLALVSCEPEAQTDKAITYNNNIVDLQTVVVEHFDRFVDAVDTYDSLGALVALETALDTAQACGARLKALPEFEGGTPLRDAAIALVEHYATGLDKEFRPILPVLVSHFSTLDQLEAADLVRLNFSEEEDHLFALVTQAQTNFAIQYNFAVTVQ